MKPFAVSIIKEILHDYNANFQAKTVEEERVTMIGSYCDNKGLNEIDLMALNDLDKTAIIAEIKRNPKKIDLNLLHPKVDSIKKSFQNIKFN